MRLKSISIKYVVPRKAEVDLIMTSVDGVTCSIPKHIKSIDNRSRTGSEKQIINDAQTEEGAIKKIIEYRVSIFVRLRRLDLVLRPAGPS